MVLSIDYCCITNHTGEQILFNLSNVTLPSTGYVLTAWLHESFWMYNDTTVPTPLQMSGKTIINHRKLNYVCSYIMYVYHPERISHNCMKMYFLFAAILSSLDMICFQQRYSGVTYDFSEVTLMTTAPVTDTGETEVGFVESCTCNTDRHTRGKKMMWIMKTCLVLKSFTGNFTVSKICLLQEPIARCVKMVISVKH